LLRCRICRPCIHAGIKGRCIICRIQCDHGELRRICTLCNPCMHQAVGRCMKCELCSHNDIRYKCRMCTGSNKKVDSDITMAAIVLE
jgi:hypothetical protein